MAIYRKITEVPLRTRRIVARMYETGRSVARITTVTGVPFHVIQTIIRSAVYRRDNAMWEVGLAGMARLAWSEKNWAWFRSDWPLEAFVDYTAAEKAAMRKAKWASKQEAEKRPSVNYVQDILRVLGIPDPEIYMRALEMSKVLTPTQLKVMLYRLSGKSVVETADELGVSHTHVQHMYAEAVTKLQRFVIE